MNQLVRVKTDTEEGLYVPMGITYDGLVVLIKPNVIYKTVIEDNSIKFLPIPEILSYQRTTHEIDLKLYKIWYLKQQLSNSYPTIKIENDRIEEYLAKTYQELSIGEIYKINISSGWYILKLNKGVNHIEISENVYQVLKNIADKQYFIDMYIKDNATLFKGVFNGDLYYKCMDIDFKYNLSKFF